MNRLPWVIMLVSLCGSLLAQQYGLERLNPAINSRDYDEISPKVSPDGSILFFTRIGYPVYDRTLLINGIDYGRSGVYNQKLLSIFHMLGGHPTSNPERSDFNQDIWYATNNVGVFDRLKHAQYPLNNALPNSVCGFSADGESVFVINQFEPHGGMQAGFSVSRKTGPEQWSFPSPLDIGDFYTKKSGVHMSMSEDASMVVMSLMRDDSYGGTDLYVSFRKAPNEYTVPINLGPDVNSEYNEEAPFICADNKTIYFTSDRPGTYGGKDIYSSIRQDITWAAWSLPLALPEPINSRKDDNQPFYHTGTGYLYFVSNRQVSSDIYRVRHYVALQTKDPDNTVYTQPEAESTNPRSIKADTESIAQVYDMTVSTYDAVTKKALKSRVTYNGKNIETTDGKLTYQYTYPSGPVKVSKEGYFEQEIWLSREQMESGQMTVMLQPMVENGKIETERIFFVQSKAAVRKDSYRVLDQLARMLHKNWNVSIMIEGHTDDQGAPDALQRLSEQRAMAVKRYLIQKGVSPMRIETIGRGGDVPLNDNSTEVLRSLNRRVEVLITKIYVKNT